MLAVVFTIFLLSLAGFPGTGGFMAKIYLLQGAVESSLWTLAITLAVVTVVSYYYYLRVAWYMWMRPAPVEGAHDRVWAPLPLRMGLLAAAAVIVYLGIFPAGLMDGARIAAGGLGQLMDGAMLGLGR